MIVHLEEKYNLKIPKLQLEKIVPEEESSTEEVEDNEEQPVSDENEATKEFDAAFGFVD